MFVPPNFMLKFDPSVGGWGPNRRYLGHGDGHLMNRFGVLSDFLLCLFPQELVVKKSVAPSLLLSLASSLAMWSLHTLAPLRCLLWVEAAWGFYQMPSLAANRIMNQINLFSLWITQPQIFLCRNTKWTKTSILLSKGDFGRGIMTDHCILNELWKTPLK